MKVDPKALDLMTSEGYTIREYLRHLLLLLWKEGEGFSSKRPFGNSGWHLDLIIPLIEAGYVEGSFDEYECLEDYDSDKADSYIKELITEHLFKKD